MFESEITFPVLVKSKYIILIAAVVGVVLVGILDAVSPFTAIAIAIFFLLSLLLFKRPNLAVVFVAFVIYTNSAVVLTKFHGIPTTIGYALPLLLVFTFLWQVIVNKQKVIIDIVLMLMLIFLSITLLGTAFSRDITSAMPGLINYCVEGLAIYFLLTNTIRTPKLLRQVVWAILIGGALIGALALYQQTTKTFNNSYGGFAQADGVGFTTSENLQGTVTQPRVSGSIGEKNRYAQIMLMLFPLGLFLAWGEKNRNLRLLAFVLTGFVLIGGTLAFSRGAMVATVLLIIIMTFMRYIKVRELAIVMLGLVLLVIAFPQMSQRFSTLGAVFSSSQEGGIRSADGAIVGRATEMLVALYVFLDHPVVGVGPGMVDIEMPIYSKIIGLRTILTTRQPHSLYLGVAAEYGATGLITLLIIFGIVLYRLAMARKYWLELGNTIMANLCTGFFLAVISYMATGLFLHFAYIRYFWLMIALAAIASSFRKQDLETETETEIETVPADAATARA